MRSSTRPRPPARSICPPATPVRIWGRAWATARVSRDKRLDVQRLASAGKLAAAFIEAQRPLGFLCDADADADADFPGWPVDAAQPQRPLGGHVDIGEAERDLECLGQLARAA